MGSIFLDNEDVEAISAQRKYDIPKLTNKQNALLTLTALLGFLFLITGTLLFLIIDLNILEFWGAILAISGLIFIIIFLFMLYRFDAPFRRAKREFVEHWEKTGEIKPRWPVKLEK